MRRLISSLLQASFIRFALTGVLNTAVGLGSIFALKKFFGATDTAANLLGYAIGLIASYLVNARWSFRYSQSLAPVLPRYAATILMAYLTNLGCVHFCIQVLHLNTYLAQALGVVPYALLTYLCLRWFVFPASPSEALTNEPMLDSD